MGLPRSCKVELKNKYEKGKRNLITDVPGVEGQEGEEREEEQGIITVHSFILSICSISSHEYELSLPQYPLIPFLTTLENPCPPLLRIIRLNVGLIELRMVIMVGMNAGANYPLDSFSPLSLTTIL